MKKALILIACTVWVFLIVTNARATSLDFGDAYYVGWIIDGVPSSPTLEAGYINNLITLAAGQGNTPIGTETYNREGSVLSGLGSVGTLQQDDTDPFTVPTNYGGYILGKYDADNPGAGAYVWYVPAGAYVVPGKSPETWDPEKGMYRSFGLSHVTYTSTTVPEPGILILLGIVMSAIGAASWKISKL